MTACYLSSVLRCWKKSPNSYIMLRMCPRFMTNNWVFTLLSAEDKVFTPYFQSVRAMPALYVKHEIRGSSMVTLHLLSSGFCGSISNHALAQAYICTPSPLCCRRMTFLHGLHRQPDYTSKLDRAGECSWKCDRMYCETVWKVPGAISAC